nr:hypothetical protein [Tanacetum cinerariifolium]
MSLNEDSRPEGSFESLNALLVVEYEILTTDSFREPNEHIISAFSKGSEQALLTSKIKVARYLDFGLELLVPEHLWINEVRTYDISASYGISHWWLNRQKFYIDRQISDLSRKVVRTHMRILSVVSIKSYSHYGHDYLKEITLRRADYQEYTIAEKDFKNLYPRDFEDLNLLLLQEKTKDEESFDPIAKMPENSDDEGNDEENIGLNVGREEG